MSALPSFRYMAFRVLAISAAIRQSGLAEPGGSMNFSDRRNRRSPFIEVRFISPGWVAGSSMCASSASVVGYRLMPTTYMPPLFLQAS